MEILQKKGSAAIAQARDSLVSELVKKIQPIARKAEVSEIITGFYTKPCKIRLDGRKTGVMYIDLIAAIRGFTPGEQAESGRYGRSPDSRVELQRLLRDSGEVLAMAAEVGLADTMLRGGSQSCFTDEISFLGQKTVAGYMIISLSLVKDPSAEALAEAEKEEPEAVIHVFKDDALQAMAV